MGGRSGGGRGGIGRGVRVDLGERSMHALDESGSFLLGKGFVDGRGGFNNLVAIQIERGGCDQTMALCS
jgi:hypothetical protein